jgi:hypothetical protein
MAARTQVLVAIFVGQQQSLANRESFKSEFNALAGISHLQNIVKMHMRKNYLFYFPCECHFDDICIHFSE